MKSNSLRKIKEIREEGKSFNFRTSIFLFFVENLHHRESKEKSFIKGNYFLLSKKHNRRKFLVFEEIIALSDLGGG